MYLITCDPPVACALGYEEYHDLCCRHLLLSIEGCVKVQFPQKCAFLYIQLLSILMLYSVIFICALLQGASSVHFQDFNAEVLRNLTIHNVNANLEKAKSQLAKLNSDGATANKRISIAPDLHYYAGDWGEVHTLLSVAQSSASPQMDPMKNGGLENWSCSHGSDLLTTQQDEQDVHDNDKSNIASGNSSDSSTSLDTKRLSSSCACDRRLDRKGRAPTRQGKGGGYDIILMSETVYSMASLPKLYELIKKVVCLHPISFFTKCLHTFDDLRH
jgi:hypothetical protein